MINVEISPFGRQLMAMMLGVAKHQSMVKQKNLQIFQQEKQAIQSLEKEQNMWNDISFDMTTRMIDKRYSSSKDYVGSGGSKSGSLRYKKTVTDDQMRFQYIAEQNMLKSRVRYQTAVSTHNKRIADQKVKATFKLSDLKKVI